MPAKDLSEQLTVFVLTVGDERNFSSCMACLDRQTAGFRLEVIDGVAPMAAAMAEMISRCRTPFYIQVDEDMHLFPHAVKSLYDAITGAPPEVALVSWPLWDCDIERAIYGVKVYRHEILREFPYKDAHSAERDQDLRLMDAGFEVVPVPLNGRAGCLGEHGKHYTPRSIYVRWRRQAETRRLDGPHRGRGVPRPRKTNRGSMKTEEVARKVSMAWPDAISSASALSGLSTRPTC